VTWQGLRSGGGVTSEQSSELEVSLLYIKKKETKKTKEKEKREKEKTNKKKKID